MKTVEGKQVSLVGNIVSLSFSLVGLIVFAFLVFSFSLDGAYIEFEESILLEIPDMRVTEIKQTFNLMKVIYNVGMYGSLFFLVTGFIILILLILINQGNKKSIGVIVIIDSVIHLFAFRILSFTLLLIGGIKMISRASNVDEVIINNKYKGGS